MEKWKAKVLTEQKSMVNEPKKFVDFWGIIVSRFLKVFKESKELPRKVHTIQILTSKNISYDNLLEITLDKKSNYFLELCLFLDLFHANLSRMDCQCVKLDCVRLFGHRNWIIMEIFQLSELNLTRFMCCPQFWWTWFCGTLSFKYNKALSSC